MVLLHNAISQRFPQPPASVNPPAHVTVLYAVDVIVFSEGSLRSENSFRVILGKKVEGSRFMDIKLCDFSIAGGAHSAPEGGTGQRT